MNARKKLLEKFLATIVPLACTVTGINALALSASAASQVQDGIEATLTVTSEENDGSLDANLVILNTNNFDLENVSIDFISPSGYALSESSQIPNTIEVLKAGEQRTFSVEYVKAGELSSKTVEVSTPKPIAVPVNNFQSGNAGSSNNTSNASNNASNNRTSQNSTSQNSQKQISSVETGDSFPMPLLISIAIASGAGMVLCIKNKKGKKMLSLLLVGAMCGTMASELRSIPTFAAGTFEVHSFTIEENIDVATQTLTVKVTLTYNYPSGEVKTENINFDMGNALYDEQSGTYYLFDEKQQLNGTVRDYENLKEVSYTITDCNDTELMSGELSPSENWSIDNLGLIVGENNITLSLKYDDESTASSTIKVNNLCEANMQSLDVDRGDDDGDGVLNFIEVMYHTDPENADSDGDTLSDYDEMATLGTNPMEKDSDGNGIDDNAEDSDGDGLTNYDEIYVCNTNPVSIDSDGDGLSDSDEINVHHTDPNNPDTDGDEADDYWEVQNGFDPLTFDSDFGDLDPTGNGTIRSEDGTEITIVFDDAFIDESTPGYMGVNPYHVELGENESTNISIPFDSSNLSEEDAPTICYFNEDTQLYEEVPTTITEDGQAVATVDKSGTYVLLNRRYVYDVWENDIIKPSDSFVEQGSLDIAFVIDCSGSMSDNDPNSIRQKVAKEFIEKLRDEDSATIITFTDSATTLVPLTKMNAVDENGVSGRDVLLSSIDGVSTQNGCGAGTNGSAGIRNALDELSSSTAAYKYVIFLTDGDDTSYLSGYESEDAAYTALENEAKGNIVIHTVGLVGTGGVDINRLKQVADETGGTYYLATTGAEAENTSEDVPIPEDTLTLEDVYSDIERITIDRHTDSNDDGINDYYTKLLCEGKIKTSKGTLVFGGASYEEVQKPENADYDHDGLLNGEEIEIIGNESGVYAKVNSYPFMADSDGDGLSDYDETRIFGTSPLKFNTSVDKDDVDTVTNNDYYHSSYWRELYNSNALVRGSVYIGNAFYGNTIIQESFYEKVLIDYFTDLNNELFEYENDYNKQAFLSAITEEAFREDFQKCYEAAENEDETSLRENVQNLAGLLNDFCDVAGMGENGVKSMEAYNELLNIANGNQAKLDYINSILTKVETNTTNLAYTIDTIGNSPALDGYAEALKSIKGEFTMASDTLQVKMNSTFLAKLGKGINTIDNGVKEALPILDKAAKVGDIFTVISIGVNSYNSIVDAYEEYSGFITNLEVMQKNIYVLDSICATTENIYLRSAANNLRYDVLLSMNDLLNGISVDTSTCNTIISISLDILGTVQK